VVEIDGSQHMEEKGIQKDRQRDAYLKSRGLEVLRFDNLQVLRKLDAVMETIFRAMVERSDR
ncbi:MAG: DUF559 domain-containing protein, partial [Nitrospinae bacterium]|nr:DUF559 domain-containing protein [Nitrospinota bacterium]